VGVAGYRQVLLRHGAIKRDFGDLARELRHPRQFLLQPKAGRNQHLVVAAAAGVDLAAGIAQAFGQSCLDGGMAVLETIVEDEGAVAEIIGQIGQLPLQPAQFVQGEDADALQAFGVGRARGDIVQEERAVQQHVVAGQEGLDAGVHRHPGLLPQKIAHAASS